MDSESRLIWDVFLESRFSPEDNVHKPVKDPALEALDDAILSSIKQFYSKIEPGVGPGKKDNVGAVRRAMLNAKTASSSIARLVHETSPHLTDMYDLEAIQSRVLFFLKTRENITD